MTVNGIELKEGQVWKTKNYGVVTLSDSGVSANYPWCMTFPNNGDPIGSVTTDGKYWEEDEMPELLECIYNPEDKGEKKPMKFNPQPGDKIICNNGEEFICCTKEFLRENISKGNKSCKPILGYRKYKHYNVWQDWYEYGTTHLGYDEWAIREVIPAESKEIVKEDDPMYTVDEVFFAIKQHVGYESPLDYKDGIKNFLKNLKEDPEYKEYLRIKAIINNV